MSTEPVAWKLTWTRSDDETPREHAFPPAAPADARTAFESALSLLDGRHALGCIFYTPDARCSCGLTRIKVDLRMAFNRVERPVCRLMSGSSTPCESPDPCTDARLTECERSDGAATNRSHSATAAHPPAAPASEPPILCPGCQQEECECGKPSAPPAAPADLDDLVGELRAWNYPACGVPPQGLLRDAADALAALEAESSLWEVAANSYRTGYRLARERAERAERERDAMRAALREIARAPEASVFVRDHARAALGDAP